MFLATVEQQRILASSITMEWSSHEQRTEIMMKDTWWHITVATPSSNEKYGSTYCGGCHLIWEVQLDFLKFTEMKVWWQWNYLPHDYITLFCSCWASMHTPLGNETCYYKYFLVRTDHRVLPIDTGLLFSPIQTHLHSTVYTPPSCCVHNIHYYLELLTSLYNKYTKESASIKTIGNTLSLNKKSLQMC